MNWRTLILYAFALAAGAFVLQWLEFDYVARTQPAELYITLIAIAFAALGIWVGTRLTRRRAPADFTRNDAAAKSLGLTERELAVLGLLVSGQSNKEIARSLDVSPNTVKTHMANLYAKLEVQRRVQAVQKARLLRLVP